MMFEPTRIAPSNGTLGVLTPGMGAVSTTFMAGVELVRKGGALGTSGSSTGRTNQSVAHTNRFTITAKMIETTYAATKSPGFLP